MITSEFNVQGMTCGHCAQAVTTEIQKLSGITDVRVSVEHGTVTVVSEAALNIDDVSTAVDEAGYELVR